jgi:hypothetical protein
MGRAANDNTLGLTPAHYIPVGLITNNAWRSQGSNFTSISIRRDATSSRMQPPPKEHDLRLLRKALFHGRDWAVTYAKNSLGYRENWCSGIFLVRCTCINLYCGDFPLSISMPFWAVPQAKEPWKERSLERQLCVHTLQLCTHYYRTHAGSCDHVV